MLFTSPSLIFATSPYTTGAIFTVAGTGTSGYNGDNQLATDAQLSGPQGIAVDKDGNIYIAELNSNRIRKVIATTGIITTVAGTGTSGYNGDNQLATNAHLSIIRDVAVDEDGNIYIADQGNQRIRKVIVATGIITTVAGTGTFGYNGDNQLATNAHLRIPEGVAVDSNANVYIVDRFNQRIRKVIAATGIITTVAGTGNQGYNGDNQLATNADLSLPRRVAVDETGNIYIVDQNNDRIRKIIAATGIITTVAGTGTPGYNGDNQPATNARLSVSRGLAVDKAGNIYIADQGNHRVRKVIAQTGIIITIAGTGTPGYNGDNQSAINAELAAPEDVAIDTLGHLYISDYLNARIRKVTPYLYLPIVIKN